jgi:hypothetical protein
MMAATLPDRRGLLAALVLTPTSFSRNRFFEMFRNPEMKATRKRASQLRGLIQDLCIRQGNNAAVVDEEIPTASGYQLTYRVPMLGLKRTIQLDEFEHALVLVAMGRVIGEDVPQTAKERVQEALVKLLPTAA